MAEYTDAIALLKADHRKVEDVDLVAMLARKEEPLAQEESEGPPPALPRAVKLVAA